MRTGTPSAAEINLCRAQNATDKFWHRKSDTFMLRVALGRPIETFPDLSEAAAERTAGQARSALAELKRIDVGALPHQMALTWKIVRFQLEIEAQESERYWLAQNYNSFPSMFPVATYGAGYLFTMALKTFTDFEFCRSSDCDRYLTLLEDYAYLIDQMRQRLAGQASRDIRIPRPALPGMRRLVLGQSEAARHGVPVDLRRLRTVSDASGFTDILTRRIQERVMPAFAALLESLGDDYGRKAPESVGMAQFNGGVEIYERLVAEQVSFPITVDAIHRLGNEHMTQVEGEMADIRASLGKPQRQEFHRYLHADPAWSVQSVACLQERFESTIRRIEPRIQELFHFKPSALYRVARLDRTLEAGMTNGYYQEPMAGHPDGVYYFNGTHLSERTLATMPSLIYHELIPGHHFHFASQKENEFLHPLRQNSFFNAFNEGWAEYAAGLAGEVGLYSDPHERYGRLLMDAFVIGRLVVDTGMNALGWSLEQARTYMREHTALSEAEIASESLRYSTDIPAQGLAYKLGELKVKTLRDRARSALRDRFDIRDFHDVVLGSGGMPLNVLEWHVSRWIRTQAVEHEPDRHRSQS